MTIMLKRINKEFLQILEKYPDADIKQLYHITISLSYIIKNETNLYIGLEIQFKLDYSYPFRYPKVFIKEMVISKSKWGWHNYLDILKKTTTCNISLKNQQPNEKKGCLYCNSIVCPDNWKPSYKILSILDEIDRNKDNIYKFFTSR